MTWETVPLGEVAELHYGKALKAEDRQGTSYPVVGSGGVVGSHSEALVREPTIVVGRKGSIGSLTYAPDGCWPIDTAYFVTLRKEVDLRWLYWAMHSLGLENLNRSAAVPGLNRDDAYRVPIPLPPLAEQRRIAAILDEADALRVQHAQAQTAISETIDAIFMDSFGSIQQLQQHADVQPLSTLADVIDCPHSTPQWTESGITCVRTSNLGRGYWNWSDHRFVAEETHAQRTRRSELIEGDVILSREGTVGVAAIVPPDITMSMGQRLVQVRPNRQVLESEYLLQYLLQSTDPKVIGYLMVGSTSTHLNVRDLRALRIHVPPLASQRQYAEQVGAVRSAAADMENRARHIDSLFASLQHRAFRGEL